MSLESIFPLFVTEDAIYDIIIWVIFSYHLQQYFFNKL